jgi:integrase
LPETPRCVRIPAHRLLLCYSPRVPPKLTPLVEVCSGIRNKTRSNATQLPVMESKLFSVVLSSAPSSPAPGDSDAAKDSPLAAGPAVHTPGHIACPACDQARKRMLDPNFLASLAFSGAAAIWLDGHRQHVSAGTVKDYENCIKALEKFFAALPLKQIHIGHFEQYQKMRTVGSGGLRPVGPSRVNHELNTLSQILGRAGLWAPIAPYYRPLRLPRSKAGRALSPEEEERLFRAAASNPRWLVAYCFALISANTAAGPNEIRHLRLRDLDLHGTTPTIHVSEGIKNDYRARSLPLNELALWAAKALLKRAKEIGACAPEHYLMPHRAANGKQGFDWTRPISSWRGAWKRFTADAGIPDLKMYALRHHALTLLFEDENVSEQTAVEIAGWNSPSMKKTYSHIRVNKRREALEALAKRKPQTTEPKTGGRLMLVKK